MDLSREKLKEIERDLASVINKHSLENLSNTPDFILAQFMIGSLKAASAMSKSREKWYGKFLSIGQTVKCTSCNCKKEKRI